MRVQLSAISYRHPMVCYTQGVRTTCLVPWHGLDETLGVHRDDQGESGAHGFYLSPELRIVFFLNVMSARIRVRKGIRALVAVKPGICDDPSSGFCNRLIVRRNIRFSSWGKQLTQTDIEDAGHIRHRVQGKMSWSALPMLRMANWPDCFARRSEAMSLWSWFISSCCATGRHSG